MRASEGKRHTEMMCDIYTLRLEEIIQLCGLKKSRAICLGEMAVNHKLQHATCFLTTRCSEITMQPKAAWLILTIILERFICSQTSGQQGFLFVGGSSTVYLDVLSLYLQLQSLATIPGWLPMALHSALLSTVKHWNRPHLKLWGIILEASFQTFISLVLPW